MVLLEATNLSEGRGTTRPFELFGAPWLDQRRFRRLLFSYELPGCTFREHGFIPTFQKWSGQFCNGMQIHVTNPRAYRPVLTAAAILKAAKQASDGAFAFTDPPYEYETIKPPIDILAGSPAFREWMAQDASLADLSQLWDRECGEFCEQFHGMAHYGGEGL
jgi:uncharacterized protein YbbC (DUF1343 family)